MFARATCLLLVLAPSLASAAECDGGIFVATGDVTGDGALAGKLLSGLTLELVGIDPDEIDYDGTVEGIDPDEIDYDGTVEGIDPDEIDYDGGACLETDATGAGLPGATIFVDGLALTGIDPDEIDAAWAKRVLAATGQAQTREHILLARQVEVPGVTVETTGYAVLRLDGLDVRTEVVTKSPYVTRAVADLTLTVVKLVSTDARVEPVQLWIDGRTELTPAR